MDKEETMRQFFEFIGDDIIVGQNVIFDYGFLKQWKNIMQNILLIIRMESLCFQ